MTWFIFLIMGVCSYWWIYKRIPPPTSETWVYVEVDEQSPADSSWRDFIQLHNEAPSDILLEKSPDVPITVEQWKKEQLKKEFEKKKRVRFEAYQKKRWEDFKRSVPDR